MKEKTLQFVLGSLLWNLLMCVLMEASVRPHAIVIKAFFLFGLMYSYLLWAIEQPLPQHRK